MKKLLLTLGASVAAVAPVMTLLACGEKEETEDDKKVTDAFKLGTSTINGTDLSFKIEAVDAEVKKFKAGDVTTVLNSIADALIKNISEEKEATKLAATKIKFDKSIDFDFGTSKASIGNAVNAFAVTGYSSINELKTGLNTSETAAAAKAEVKKAVINLYGSASDTESMGYKLKDIATEDLEETKLKIVINTDQILLDYIVPTSEAIINALAESVKTSLAGLTGDVLEGVKGATLIKFSVKFKDVNKKVEVSNTDTEISVTDLSGKDTEQSSTLEGLVAELTSDTESVKTAAENKVIEEVKTALKKA